MNEQYLFFWNGPFSQWYRSKFVAEGIEFCTAEQYMMYQKAVLFSDWRIADEILLTKEPKEQKALGRKVFGFDPEIWNAHARDIVTTGNYAKFTQNERLKGIILDSGDKILVEASPYDKIWGIGLDVETAKVTPVDQWKGTNWLGECLMQVRYMIKNA